MFDKDQRAYKRFRDTFAERIRPIVAWTGAGLSRPAGLPGWVDLRKNLEDAAIEKVRNFETDDAGDKAATVRSIQSIPDYWTAFGRLKDILGRSTYEATVREAFKPAETANIPAAYSQLWRLRIGGILTLNVDRFAARSFPHQGKVLNEVPSGFDAGQHAHILKSRAPFVINLHGVINNASSWVFTGSEIRALLNNDAYRAFTSAIFLNNTVLFVGISADDVAAGGILGRLRSIGIDPGEQFWLTNRSDPATSDWAEQNGLQMILYRRNDDHEKALQQIFEDLQRFVPQDREAAPVFEAHRGGALPVLPQPAELAVKPAEEIRQTLSAHAATILQEDGATSQRVEKYNEFVGKYSRAVHNSWYVSVESPDNILFGYRIERQIGGGAFGSVYKARSISGDGQDVAIKLLLYEIRTNSEMLGSFRRGVESMRILSDAGVQGMVPYLHAYELPPCTVMEFIEGANLEEAVDSGLLDKWVDGLRIGLEVARIVRNGHNLPQRVFHRDILPANIMLREFYTATVSEDWEIVVLDFDLSWHREAAGKSIMVRSEAGVALGYLAPEQLGDIKGVSTRSAVVDSYGLGMTLYFLFTGEHPTPNASSQNDWRGRLGSKIRDEGALVWRSVPGRLARLIERATHPVQNERLDMAQIQTELERLRDTVLRPVEVDSAELWAEELLSRAFPDRAYEWDVDRLSGAVTLVSGVTITVGGQEVEDRVSIDATRPWTADQDWRHVDKYFATAKDRAASSLRHAGWRVRVAETSSRTVRVQADIGVDALQRSADAAARGLEALGLEFSF